MNERNNLGRQYTSDPNFGKVYPNTQYKGYSEHEAAPFGNPSNAANNLEIHSNQYGYVGHSQSRNPYQPENRNFDVRSHGYAGSQYSQRQTGSQYQGMSGQTPYGTQTVGMNQSRMQGQSQYQAQQPYQSGQTYQGGSQYQSAQQSSLYQGSQNQGTQYQATQSQQGNTEYGAGTIHTMGAIQTQGNAQNQGNPMQSKANQAQAAMTSQAGQQQKGPQYNDRDRINDLLTSEKYLTEGYNISTFEATNPQLHDTLKNILNETHENRETLYREMENRGWYKTEPADQQQISQAHNQFSGYRSQLPF